MNTLTKEWLQNTITSIESVRDEIPFGLDEDQNNMLTALKIALASLEAKPVAWTDDEELRDVKQYGFGEIFQCPPDKYADPRRVISLYREPPAVPAVLERLRAIVSDPRALPRRKEWVSGQQYSYVLLENVEAMVDEACRAAMLQGSQPVSQTYKLPVNTPCQDAPAHIWLQTAGVWPEDGELSELTWCSHNQHHDDTLYVRADLVNGNSPVTPDGWISCSERMPDKLIPVMVMYEDGEMWSAMWNGNRWDDGTEYPDPHSVTHWREMPAAPQQEVK